MWISLCKTSAQTLDQTLVLADSAWGKGQFAQASSHYLRVIFFDSTQKNTAYCYAKVADCFAQTQQPDRAKQYYDLAYAAATTDSLRAEIILAKSLTLLTNYQYDHAAQELYNMPRQIPTMLKRRRDLYLGLTYFALENFDQSQLHLLNSVADCPAQQQAIKTIFEQQKTSRKKNVTLAKILSIILPGAGQLYAHDTRNAINSLAINGVFVYLFVATGINYNFLSAAITVLPWLERYYVGGINKAAQSAYLYNYSRQLQRYEQLINTTQNCDSLLIEPKDLRKE